MWNLPDAARVVEVGLRDGLQAIEEPLDTSTKLKIVDQLIESGVREIEVASFAHPKVLPQLADAVEVIDRLPRDPSIRYRALVPNAKGAERAADTMLDEIAVVIPAEDGMALKNQGKTTDQLIDELSIVADFAASAGQRLIVGVACAFFSPCFGPVSAPMRNKVVQAAQDVGAHGVYLANTTGQEHPREVYEGLKSAKEAFPNLECGAHLHNRNGFAPANALAALSAATDWLETSFAALGGDMWFPGDPTVLGNMATEDLVHLLDGMGITTGIDLEAARSISSQISTLTDFPISSFVSRGGTRQDLANATWEQ